MSGILRLKGASSGYVEFSAPDSGANTTVNAGLLVYKDSANGTITGVSTNDISEASNLYYTTARFDSDFGTKDISSYDSALVQGQFDSALPVALASDVSLGNITTTGYLRGPSTFVIDPATHGDDTGTLRVAGNLTVDGTTTTINSTTVTTADKNIVIAQGAADSAAADGAGITIDTVDASLTYVNFGPGEWELDRRLIINTDTTNETYGPQSGGSFGLTIGDAATDSDSICSIKFNSRDAGDNNRHFASIAAQKTGQWAGSGGSYPGALTFWTRPSSGNQSERMRIDKDGNVGIGTNSPGVPLSIAGGTGDLLSVGNEGTNSEFIIGNWSNTSDADIDGLLPGSTFGTIMRGAPNGHVVMALRENDISDSFTIVSGGGNYQADSAFDTIVSSFRSNGDVSIGGNASIGTSKLVIEDDASETNSTYDGGVGYLHFFSNVALFSAPKITAQETGSNIGAEIAFKNVGSGAMDILFRNRPNTGTGTTMAERMRINTDGNVLPGASGTQDLGSSSLRWGTVYTSDLSLKNENGDWTIVEGEDDLFLYNNKKGKVYKFALTEVDPDTAPAKRD